MAAKNMPITARQAMAIVGFTGLTEELVRLNWRTSGEASTLIGLAADGNGEAVFMAVSEKGLAASPTIASLVEAYAAKKRAKAEEMPSTPAPSPATPRVVATEGARRKRTRYATLSSAPCRCSTSPSNRTFWARSTR